jgi:hypothetical protein
MWKRWKVRCLPIMGEFSILRKRNQSKRLGPVQVSLVVTTLNSFILLVLYLMEASWTLPSNTEKPFLLTERVQVSKSTTSRLSNHAFLFKESCRKLNLLIPYDQQFNQEKLLRAWGYVCILSSQSQSQLAQV